jgi:hypothetical protein
VVSLSKKSIVKYEPKIFALYRSALVEHMKGVKGKPPVMLFVAVAVAFFAIIQLGSYVKTHGGIIPKPNVSQSQEKEVKNENRPSFFGSPSPSGSSGFSSPSSVFGSSPSYSYPSSLPSVSSGSSSFPSSPSASSSLPSPSPSSVGYGYIVIEVARPSARPPASSEDVLKPSVKVVEIP